MDEGRSAGRNRGPRVGAAARPGLRLPVWCRAASTGMLDVKRAGAATYAEAESTCVVFGMPREAIAPGGVGQVLPLQDIAGKVPLRFGKERAVRA